MEWAITVGAVGIVGSIQEGEAATMEWAMIIGVVGTFLSSISVLGTILLVRRQIQVRRDEITFKTLEQIDELVKFAKESYQIELNDPNFTFEEALQKYKDGSICEQSPEFQHLDKVVREFEPILTKLENIESLLQAKSLDEKLFLSRTGGIIRGVYRQVKPTVLEFWDTAHLNVKDVKDRPYYELLWTDVKKLNKRLNKFDAGKMNQPNALDRFISSIRGFLGARGA